MLQRVHLCPKAPKISQMLADRVAALMERSHLPERRYSVGAFQALGDISRDESQSPENS